MSNAITCPHCHQEFEITESLRAHLDAEYKERWEVAKRKLESALRDQLTKEQSVEVSALRDQLDKKNVELLKLEKQELTLRQRERELEEKARKQDLELERKLAENKTKWIDEFKKQEAQLFEVKLLEKEKQMKQMQDTIDSLQRQSKQNSMQVQGDAAEEDLKHRLQLAFPVDLVEDVATGQVGADLLETVRNAVGSPVGSILWESKRTKSFSEDWIGKLKSDQVATKTTIAIIVTDSLPKNSSHFFERKGVWICHTPLAISLATAIRAQLLAVSQMKVAQQNAEITVSQLYNYVTTSEFKTRVEQIVLTYVEMKAELDREARALRVGLQRREKQLDRMIAATAGLYGDVQGIIGPSLPKIEQLELDETQPQSEQLLLDGLS